MAARIAGFLAGGSWAVGAPSRRGDRRQPARSEARSLLFLIVLGIVGAASTGGLFAVGFAFLLQSKAAQHQASPHAAAAPPARISVAAKAPSPPAISTSHGTAAAPAPPASPIPAAIGFALAEGDANFHDGQISTARFYYEQAVDAGSAAAAVRLGETFDPAYLTQDRLRWLHADPAAARYWYGRALDLGAPEAKIRIAKLDAEPAAGHPERAAHATVVRRQIFISETHKPPGAALQRLLDRILHPPAVLHPPAAR
jgi:TPR repeat protein